MKQTSTKPTLLLVEDEFTHYTIIKTYFKNIFNCVVAKTAREALEITENNQFDIILMDIGLDDEKLDGIAIMKKIKEKKAFKDVKIFAVTSYAMPGDREYFLREGFDGYIAKPVILSDLKDIIYKAIAI